MPNTPNAHRPIAIRPPLNTRSRRKPRSIIGLADRVSTITKAIAAAAARTKAARMLPEVQPRDSPSMSAYVRANRASDEVTRPGRSNPRVAPRLPAGMLTAPRTAVATPIGTLIRKIQPQEACWLSQPPVNGPTASASAPTPPQTPIAVPRSRGSGNSAGSSASEAGVSSAAPMPCTARLPISISWFWARPADTEATVKTARPAKNASRGAEHVGDPAAGQQQTGEDQHVRARDPFQAGDAQVEVPLDGREGHVDHVVVEVGHEGAERHRDERPPPAVLLHRTPPIRRPCTSYMYLVYETCTLYGCQVASERLSKAAVAERALRLGDEEGLEAVTIRRLAQALGVTPMALYWHFKNKDELLLGIVDHALATVRADRAAADPWHKQLRAMVEALVAVMRRHPSLPELMHMVDKAEGESFVRASNDALALLTEAGFGVQEAYWIASYLLHGAIGLVQAQPDCPANVPAAEAPEWRRQKRLALESLPADRYPMMVAFAATYAEEPDTERYYVFGIDLLMSAVEATAARRG